MLNIYCDGGSRGNPGPAASAFVIKDQSGEIIHQSGKFIGIATNNQAEYKAVIFALVYLSENPKIATKEIHINLDSILVASQINGFFKIKNPDLRNFLLKIREIESEIKSKIIYSQVPREENWQADLLVNQTLDQQ